jgi:Kef-type K+ transport system membrane component KefB
MWLADKAASHAVLPAFLLGLAVSRTFQRHRITQQRFRVVAFALLTPFFFLRSGGEQEVRNMVTLGTVHSGHQAERLGPPRGDHRVEIRQQ